VKIEKAIKQEKFISPIHKAVVNLLYTYNWYMEQTAELFKGEDLTPQQYNVLRILRGKYPEALAAGEIKEVMLDKNPDLTRLCDRLSAKGLLEREVNAVNRRQMLIKITPAGLKILDKIGPVMEEASKTWANLTDEEAEALSDLLDKLRG
jgi:MarR family 2-MHQ and catechol resistance regulon transcriptional repressor